MRSASNPTNAVMSGCRETLLTVPTRMPATRTESPALSREASANTAEYPLAGPGRYWPKIAKSSAVTMTITTAKVPNFSRGARVALIPVDRSGHCCAAVRRAVRTTIV